MLETLRIQNYALIESLEIELHPGFNVLTGETGAGKSILVGALGLVLGGRASSDVVRKDARKAVIEAAFRIGKPTRRLRALLKEHGLELDEGVLLLARHVGADGRSKGFACGNMTPISVLASIGDELVDLHGQHEHQSLLKVDRQLDLLDAYAGAEEAAQELSAGVAAWRASQREYESLASDDRDRVRQMEFLRFEVDEIDQAAFECGEEESLRTRRQRITNAEGIQALAAKIYGVLYESDEHAAAALLGAAERDLEELAALESGFGPLLQQLAEARTTIEAVAEEVRAAIQELEFDPEELENLNQRLNLLSALKRKYGASIGEIQAYRDQAATRLEQYERRDERLEELRAACAAREQALLESARALSGKRLAAARKLDRRVREALQDLGMKGAVFETRVEETPLSSTGVDRVEFLLAANAGEPVKPLRQVASGGEISRVMLALKATFAEADHIPTLIFDEIDAGVGGSVARKLAAKVAGLAETHQVLCITHLPQIAAAARAHFHVSKATRKKRTLTQVAQVEGEERRAELARLLDGSVSEVSLEHARALLDEAGAAWDASP